MENNEIETTKQFIKKHKIILCISSHPEDKKYYQRGLENKKGLHEQMQVKLDPYYKNLI